MARINTAFDVSPEAVRSRIRRWTSTEETRNFAFLILICQTFQNKVKEYYKAGPTAEDRFQRLCEIRQALTEIGFTDGERIFSIAPVGELITAPPDDSTDPEGFTIPMIHSQTRARSCPSGEKDVGGICVDS